MSGRETEAFKHTPLPQSPSGCCQRKKLRPWSRGAVRGAAGPLQALLLQLGADLPRGTLELPSVPGPEPRTPSNHVSVLTAFASFGTKV